MSRYPHPYEWEIVTIFTEAMKLGPFPALKGCTSDHNRFITTFNLKTGADLGRLTDPQITDHFRGEPEKAKNMIALRDCCRSGKKTSRVNDIGAPVKESGWNCLWYCGRLNVPGSVGSCGPRDGPQCTSCSRLQWSHPPPFAKKSNLLNVFLDKIKEEMKQQVPPACTQLFEDPTKIESFRSKYKISLVEDFMELTEEQVYTSSFTDAENEALLDIHRSLHTNTNQHWVREEHWELSELKKKHAHELSELRMTMIEGFNRRDRWIAEDKERIEEAKEKIRKLEGEAEVAKKRKRDEDVMYVLADLSGHRVEGSVEHVEQAWCAAKKLATNLEAQVNDMKRRDTAQKNAKNEYLCSITQELMRDPVQTMTGQTYERTAIETWLEHNNTCPKTNVVLASTVLIPNHSLRSLIEEFVAQQSV